jgi:heat shock protein HslJ
MRTRALRLFLLLAVVGIAGAVGCQSGSGESEDVISAEEAPGTIRGTWTLQTVDGVPVSEMMSSTLRSPSLTIADDGTLNGFSGVNNFHGSLSPTDLANGTFRPGPMAMTMMAGPEDAMRVEGRFMQDLHAATGIIVRGDTLNLTEGDVTLLTFARDN